MNATKPGFANIRRGMLVAMAGLVLPVGSHWFFNGIGGVWLLGASLLGGILFLVGIGQYARYERLPRAKKVRKHLAASRAGLLTAMDAVKKEHKANKRSRSAAYRRPTPVLPLIARSRVKNGPSVRPPVAKPVRTAEGF